MKIDLKDVYDALVEKGVAKNRSYSKHYYNRPYNKPELYGFETLDEIDIDQESYQFNIIAVLRRKSDGTLWWAHDSGRSCPNPFEDVFEWERLFNTDELEKIWLGRYSKNTTQKEWDEFISKVKDGLKALSEAK